MPDVAFPCPCCGYLTSSAPGGWDICPICAWEDDLSQLRFPLNGGANRISLADAQSNFAAMGAKTADHVQHVRSPTADDARDPLWRPLDPVNDDIESPAPGRDYGLSYPTDLAELYYWRRSVGQVPEGTE